VARQGRAYGQNWFLPCQNGHSFARFFKLTNLENHD